MTTFTVLVLALCFVFGIFENVYSDQPKAAEETQVVTAPNEEEKSDVNERAGYLSPVRPMGRPLGNSNPYNLVECYTCVNCPYVLPSSNRKLCPYTPDAQKQGRCVVYAERMKQTNQPVYIRGCASNRGSCAEIKRAYEVSGRHVDLLSCRECHGDRCNGAPKSMIDLTVAFITLAVLPILGKCTLS